MKRRRRRRRAGGRSWTRGDGGFRVYIVSYKCFCFKMLIIYLCLVFLYGVCDFVVMCV